MTNKEKAAVLRQLYGYLCGDPEKEAPGYSEMREAMQSAIDAAEKCDHNATEMRPDFISGEPLTLE